MAFNVELRAGAEPGRIVDRAIGIDLPWDAIDARRQQLPLLRGIDPYSKTYFGQLQMKELRDELAEVASEFEGQTRIALERLIDMAFTGSSRPHHYLVFVGD